MENKCPTCNQDIEQIFEVLLKEETKLKNAIDIAQKEYNIHYEEYMKSYNKRWGLYQKRDNFRKEFEKALLDDNWNAIISDYKDFLVEFNNWSKIVSERHKVKKEYKKKLMQANVELSEWKKKKQTLM